MTAQIQKAFTSHGRINRNMILKEVQKIIEQSPGNKAEISSSDLADKFGVKAPTMDYHLDKLVQEGKLIVAKKRGKYNRRIFSLPKGYKPLQNQSHLNVVYDNIDEFKKVLKEKVQVEKEKNTKKEDNIQNVKSIKELTLDDQIEMFLSQSEDIQTAEKLLAKEDREILSVVNESIQQQIIYLKDLADQLSTVQNKELIQKLIDERNQNQEKLQALQKENQKLKQQLQENQGKYDIQPERIRMMQQLIMNTIDNYLDQPNHSLALGRREFRNKITKEVSDLAKYALNLED